MYAPVDLIRCLLRGLTICAAFAPQAMLAGPCTPGATIDYPISEALAVDALTLSVTPYLDIDAANFEASMLPRNMARIYRDGVSQALAGETALARDVRLIALLAHDTDHETPLEYLTTQWSSGMIPLYLAALDRRGLTEHAAALRQAMQAYDRWGDDPALRQDALYDDGGAIGNAVLGAALGAASARFRAAQPPLARFALDLAQGDAALMARFRAVIAAASDQDRFSHTLRSLAGCAEGWMQDAAVLDALPAPQRNLILVDLFIEESMNGSAHQYFQSSAGALAPRLRDAFAQMDMPAHAAGIAAGMALFPTPYPVENTARRTVMAGFGPPEDEALYALTVYADNPALWPLLIRYSRKTGLLAGVAAD